MISVCIATYNGERFLHEQLESILAQLSFDDEVIISDDGSEDRTLDIVCSFNDPRIKVYINRGKHGFKENFENALNKATGDYIFLSDQDDVWMPNKVDIVVKYLNIFDLVVHDAQVIDIVGDLIGENYYSLFSEKAGFWSNLWKSRFLGCCMAFKRKVLKECLPFPKYVVAHDYWIGMYALATYRVRFISDILIGYRRHGQNVSSSSESSNTSLFYKIITKRLSLLIAICYRLIITVCFRSKSD